MPTGMIRWRLRSRDAHCDPKLAVEVQQCPLRSEAGEEDWQKLGDDDWRGSWRRGLASGEEEKEEEKEKNSCDKI